MAKATGMLTSFLCCRLRAVDWKESCAMSPPADMSNMQVPRGEQDQVLKYTQHTRPGPAMKVEWPAVPLAGWPRGSPPSGHDSHDGQAEPQSGQLSIRVVVTSRNAVRHHRSPLQLDSLIILASFRSNSSFSARTRPTKTAWAHPFRQAFQQGSSVGAGLVVPFCLHIAHRNM